MRALVIFCRTPEAEARAKGLPVAKSAPLFEAALARWIRKARDAHAEPVIACAPEHRARLARIAPDASWIEQPQGSFGARLSAVATEAFGRGYARVALTGIDTPPIDLAAVFDSSVNVIVPARDGGVNLIGLIADAPELLSSLRPRQRDAASRCQVALHAVALPSSSDLDDIGDLSRLLRAPADVPAYRRFAISRRGAASPSLRAPPA